MDLRRQRMTMSPELTCLEKILSWLLSIMDYAFLHIAKARKTTANFSRNISLEEITKSHLTSFLHVLLLTSMSSNLIRIRGCNRAITFVMHVDMVSVRLHQLWSIRLLELCLILPKHSRNPLCIFFVNLELWHLLMLSTNNNLSSAVLWTPEFLAHFCLDCVIIFSTDHYFYTWILINTLK